ncbi:MAG: hypothetical protein GY943_39150, partial [Chloroflexi bacterium]|nr:hypothetical protein [Chloroflexota bacterium]
MQRKLKLTFSKRTRQIMIMVMIVAGFIINGVLSAAAAPLAQTSAVSILAQDANGPLANQVVYAFDGTGTTYTGISATTGPAGEAALFNLADGDYLFRSDDVNGTQYWTAAICTVPTCTSDTLTMPVMGAVDVTVSDTNGSIANQVVYAFDGTGTTYTGLSATTGAAGEPASFTLPAGDYLFRADDVNGTQYWTATICDVPTCTAVTLTMPVMGNVDVTVMDTNGVIANQVVYAFDGTGTTYTGLSATTGAAGEPATFTLPAGDYLFRADDINSTQYWTATICDVPTCTAVTLTMASVGMVDVTVSDTNGVIADQVVYAFNGTGTTYTGLSATTGPAGEPAAFQLAYGDYLFRSDD